MTMYRLKEPTGCVVTEFRAVQWLGDLDAMKQAFPTAEFYAALDPVQDMPGALVVTDEVGDQRMAFYRDYVFEHPFDPGHLMVLSSPNFLDTFKVSE